MDKKLSNFLEKREHTVLIDIDVITAAVAVPLLEIDGEDHVVFTYAVISYAVSLVKLAFLVATVSLMIKAVLMLPCVNALKNWELI